MKSLHAIVEIEDSPGFRLRNGLSIAASAAVSFLILFGITQAQKAKVLGEADIFNEVRSVVLPSPPPPPPQTRQPVPSPPSLIELEASPMDSSVQLSYSISPVAPATSPPVAQPVFDFSPDAFRPTTGEFKARHVFSKSEVDEPPVAVYKKEPEFAERMMEENRTAKIRLMYIVNTEGTVEAVSLIGSGGAAFDEVVIDAIKRWRFKPAIKDGKKVNCWIRQRVILKSRSSSPFGV